MKSQRNSDLQAVYSCLASIPRGKVCSYGVLAKNAGIPGGARQIGWILKNLPKDTLLPWHRIVLASGKLAFPENSEPYKKQRTLLQLEGVKFTGQKIDVSCFLD